MANRFTREISLCGERVTYVLEYKSIRNVHIHCTPEKGLYVSAPYNADLSRIDDYLKENGERILDVVQKAKAQQRKDKPHTEQRRITLDGRSVDYELNFKNVKRINLSVSPAKGVRVSAPCSVKVKDIESFMKKNSTFILRALDKYEKLAQSQPKAKLYINGETLYFLGEKLTIQVEPSPKNYAAVSGKKLQIFAAEPDSFELRSAIVDAFLKQQCAARIPLMCRALYPRFRDAGIDYPREIRFRKMVSCWGNCRPARSILTFSTYLIQLPEKCIEQVICHEFTHFLHANHSKAFYAQLAKFMPDYKKYEDQMKQLQSEIIIKNAPKV